MKNIVRLARMFDAFVELDSSFVKVEDIKAIRKTDPRDSNREGITIVTPYGEFIDSTDFETFKTRIADTIEALKAQSPDPISGRVVAPPKIVPLPYPVNPSYSPNTHTYLPESSSGNPTIPVSVTENREEHIMLTKDGATGELFEKGTYKVVDRYAVEVFDTSGMQVAKGTDTGQIIGDTISGMIYESGKFTIAAKGFEGGNTIILNYKVKRQ